MSGHTPGPWTVAPPGTADKHRPYIWVPDAGLYVASVLDSVEAYEANARLIAAAPALADALEKAADTLRDAAATFNIFGKPVAGTAMAVAEMFCRDALRAAGRLP